MGHAAHGRSWSGQYHCVHWVAVGAAGTHAATTEAIRCPVLDTAHKEAHDLDPTGV